MMSGIEVAVQQEQNFSLPTSMKNYVKNETSSLNSQISGAGGLPYEGTDPLHDTKRIFRENVKQKLRIKSIIDRRHSDDNKRIEKEYN